MLARLSGLRFALAFNQKRIGKDINPHQRHSTPAVDDRKVFDSRRVANGVRQKAQLRKQRCRQPARGNDLNIILPANGFHRRLEAARRRLSRNIHRKDNRHTKSDRKQRSNGAAPVCPEGPQNQAPQQQDHTIRPSRISTVWSVTRVESAEWVAIRIAV